MSQIRANWRPGIPVCYESLWSVLHKFCWLNAARDTDLLETFPLPNSRGATIRSWSSTGSRTNISDLRFEGAIDCIAISRAIGVGDAWRADASFDNADARRAVRNWAVPFLRYCPACIDRGFHTAIFQIAEMKKCPIHRMQLVDCCPKCARRIPYSLPNDRSRIFSCECGRLLWWGIRDQRWPAPLESTGEVNRLAREIAARLSGKREQWTLKRDARAICWFHDRGASERRLKSMRALHVRGAAPVAETVKLFRYWRPDEFKVWPRSKRFRGSKYGVIPERASDFRSQLFDVYRRIERRILHRMPRSHRRSIPYVTRAMFKKSRSLGGRRYSLTAFVLWRCYWLSEFEYGHAWQRDSDYSQKRWRLDANRVFWRFIQHARLIGPSGPFSSGEAWGQLHFFACVAAETYSAALNLAVNSHAQTYPFYRFATRKIQQAKLPFILLTRVASEPVTFELRISSSPAAPSGDDLIHAPWPRRGRLLL